MEGKNESEEFDLGSDADDFESVDENPFSESSNRAWVKEMCDIKDWLLSDPNNRKWPPYILDRPLREVKNLKSNFSKKASRYSLDDTTQHLFFQSKSKGKYTFFLSFFSSPKT